ncbi:MAG TPA: translocation/assembly module TamB domain-containing protein [Dongiaceae bacterium]|nr:translocation/assembly module TamB domain-containing protein [Dongiaceae bacterium]
MSNGTLRRKWQWLRHVGLVLGVKVALALAVLIIFFGSGGGNPLIRRLAIRKLNTLTGGQSEIRNISIQWLSLQATVHGLVLHGKEPSGTEPLFAAEEIRAGLRIDSFWGRKVSLTSLTIREPHLHVRVEKDGSTNIPVTQRKPGKPLQDTLLDLRIRRVELLQGWVLYNDVKTPLAVEGRDLHLTLNAGGNMDQPLYSGALDWKNLEFTSKRFLPLPVSASTQFAVSRQGFTLEQGIFDIGTSRFDVHAEMTDFHAPQWNYRYRAWVNLVDFRKTLRAPLTPTGRVDLRGEGTLLGGELRGTGSYAGSDIVLTYDVFRQGGLRSTGSYRFDKDALEIPDFAAYAFGGSVKGRVTMKIPGLEFRAQTRIDGIRVSQLLPALDRPGFPVDRLHWDSILTGNTVETWKGAFEHFEISGETQWDAPDDVASGHIPVAASITFAYKYDPQLLTLDEAEFSTPSNQIRASGSLGHRDSQLDLHVQSSELEAFDDLIQSIQGVAAGTPEEVAPRIRGAANWDGKMTGPLAGPTFSGHVHGEHIAYAKLRFDSLDADVIYSPDELSVTRGRLRTGNMDAGLEGKLDLDGWGFGPDSTWTAEANLEKVPIDSLLALAGEKYPIEGLLTGSFHGHGTRSEPALTGLFDLAEGKAYGLAFNRLRGQLNVQPDEARVNNAELRIFAPGKEAGRGAGIVTGSFGYQISTKTINADLVGAALPLENFEKIQSPRFPIAGQFTFRLKASGPVRAPSGEGSIRVVDFRVGSEIIGSFDGELNSDGRQAKLQIHSAMTGGGLSGGYTLGLADPWPLSGKVQLQNIVLDPFLLTALHMEHISGHGTADGEVGVEGNLKQPESIVMDARFSRLLMNYANVQLENSGPVHFRSSKDEINIDSATFKGTDTNLQIAGGVRFTGRRTVNLNLNGALDLRLLSGFVPDLDARGPAQINAAFEGTLDRPRITGKVHIDNAQARAMDFPTGLSGIKGDLIFDASRLFFENVSAQVGGGSLSINGSVYYADRPIRFDISTQTSGVRIRYPEGMSWQVAGGLRLTGTPDGGVISGRVQIARVNLTGGLETAGALIGGTGASGPSTSSRFLRNLQFDIEAVSTPDARMEWPNAELEADANLRVRGTWEHPILLGHIHVLSGDLFFHGSRYRVARGDLNFANPFQLNPDINVEATTTIQQYEITLNFSGPANKLNLSYRSDPPLPSNDIITLLALGQTSTEGEVRSGGTGSAATGMSPGASAILSEAISSQLGGRLEKLFGITRLRVDPGLAGVGTTGSEQNAAARITVEQQITRDLTITYVSNVSSTQQQVIQVEYNVNRNVSIVALRDQNGTFGIDVKIKKRFP